MTDTVPPALRILVADDHSIVRSALKYVLSELSDHLGIVEARDFYETLDQLRQNGPFDLVLLDLRMPGAGFGTDAGVVVEAAGEAPVAVFTVSESPDEMRSVLQQGVRAYIPKSTDDSLLATILKLVLDGGTYVPPVLAGITPEDMPPTGMGTGAVFPAAGRDWNGTPLETLTRRQRDVLALMAEGLSNQDIGDRLDLNLSTVKTHVTGILRTLDVDNRTQAVLLYQQATR